MQEWKHCYIFLYGAISFETFSCLFSAIIMSMKVKVASTTLFSWQLFFSRYNEKTLHIRLPLIVLRSQLQKCKCYWMSSTNDTWHLLVIYVASSPGKANCRWIYRRKCHESHETFHQYSHYKSDCLRFQIAHSISRRRIHLSLQYVDTAAMSVNDSRATLPAVN